MNAPRPGYKKDYAVKWINAKNGETMYSSAMTKDAATRLALFGHWHATAAPMVENLRDKDKP
jgi:hypothetical protein